MSNTRALVTDGSNRRQIAGAKRIEKRLRSARLGLLQLQLSTSAGREFVWAELERHGIHDTVSGPSEAVFQFLGKRDAGIVLLRELMDDHPDAFLMMQKEALSRAQQFARELAAAQKRPTTDDTM